MQKYKTLGYKKRNLVQRGAIPVLTAANKEIQKNNNNRNTKYKNTKTQNSRIQKRNLVQRGAIPV